MAVSFSTNFILKKMMRLDAKSEAQNHRYRARGVCVAAPNKTEQIPNSVVGWDLGGSISTNPPWTWTDHVNRSRCSCSCHHHLVSTKGWAVEAALRWPGLLPATRSVSELWSSQRRAHLHVWVGWSGSGMCQYVLVCYFVAQIKVRNGWFRGGFSLSADFFWSFLKT